MILISREKSFKVFIGARYETVMNKKRESSKFISFRKDGYVLDKGDMKHQTVIDNINYGTLTVFSDDDLDTERAKMCLVTGESV